MGQHDGPQRRASAHPRQGKDTTMAGKDATTRAQALDMLEEAREKCEAIESALTAWAMLPDNPSPRALFGFSTVLRDVSDTTEAAIALLSDGEVA